MPVLKKVQFNLNVTNLSRLLRALGIEGTPALRKIGKMTLTGRANGSLFKPKLDATLKTAGANVNVSGTVSALPVIGGIDVNVNARHKNLAQLLRTLNINYRPSGRIGGLDISGAVKGSAQNIKIQGLKGQIGRVKVTGAASVNLKTTRPKISVNLKPVR